MSSQPQRGSQILQGHSALFAQGAYLFSESLHPHTSRSSFSNWSVLTSNKRAIEMAIGHILQNLVKLRQANKSADASRYKLRSDVDALLAHAGFEPRARKKPRNSG